MKFAVRVTPHAEESFVGYMARLSKFNALTHAYLMARFVKLSADEKKLFLDWVGGLPEWKLTLKAMEAVRSDRVLVCSRSMKHCPLCLSEGGYWKHSWGFKLYNVCTKHKVRLSDKCAHCGHELTFCSFSSLACSKCRQALASATIGDKATAIECWFAKMFGGLINDVAFHNDSVVCKLGIQDFHDMFLGLGRVIEFGKNLKFLGVISSSDDLMRITKTASSLAFDWPLNFHEYMASIYHQDVERWTPNECFSRLRHVLYKRLKSEEFDFVRQEFEAFLSERWAGPIDSRTTTLPVDLREHHPWKTLALAANELGIPLSRFKPLLRDGIITSSSRVHPCGKVSTVVNVHEVKEILSQHAHEETLKEVSNRLGISRSRTGQLIEGGLLPKAAKKCKSDKSWFLDCDALLDRLSPTPLDQCQGAVYSLRLVSHFQTRFKGLFVELIAAICDGEIAVYADYGPSRLSDWFVDEDQFHDWRNFRTIFELNPGSQTISAVARTLRLPKSYASWLIKNKLLKLHGSDDTRITGEELRCFRERFISIMELSNLCQAPVTTLIGYLLRGGCVAPHGLVRGPHNYEIWSRSPELCHLIFENFGVCLASGGLSGC